MKNQNRNRECSCQSCLIGNRKEVKRCFWDKTTPSQRMFQKGVLERQSTYIGHSVDHKTGRHREQTSYSRSNHNHNCCEAGRSSALPSAAPLSCSCSWSTGALAAANTEAGSGKPTPTSPASSPSVNANVCAACCCFCARISWSAGGKPRSKLTATRADRELPRDRTPTRPCVFAFAIVCACEGDDVSESSSSLVKKALKYGSKNLKL